MKTHISSLPLALPEPAWHTNANAFKFLRLSDEALVALEASQEQALDSFFGHAICEGGLRGGGGGRGLSYIEWDMKLRSLERVMALIRREMADRWKAALAEKATKNAKRKGKAAA